MPNRSGLTGQDFAPIVIRRTQEKPIKTTTTSNKSSQDEEGLPPPKMSVGQIRSLQSHRMAAGFKNQKDLSKATNGKIAPSRIAELENGKGPPPTGLEKQLLFRLVKIKF